MKDSMLCLKCKNEQFAEKCVDVPQTFRGEDFTVKAPAMVCNECGWFTMNDAQADNLCVLTADEYRRRHGLLTSAEIVAYRKACNMSQAKFAAFLAVGVASVKRWEGGTVQEPVYDDLIRRKCAGTPHRTQWTKVVSADYGSRVTKFHVTTVLGTQSRNEPMTHTGSICTSSNVTFHIQLSDGHPWRADHYNAKDSTLPPSA